MKDVGQTQIEGNANIVGSHSKAQSQQVTINFPRDLLERYETEENPTVVWTQGPVTIILLSSFVLFCAVAVVGPLIFYEYSTRSPAMQDVQNLVLTLSSAMSGITGLIGVLVGYRVRSRALVG